MTQLDVVSFFAFLLILSAFAMPLLWNFSIRRTRLHRITLRDGMLGTLAWMFFTIGVLVLIEAFRNMLEPGLWERERLFAGLQPGQIIGADAPVWNLLCGWFLFPLRKISQVEFSPEGIAVGAVTFLVVMLTLEILGRRTLGKIWQTRWTFTTTAAFVLLDVMTYSTVALVRQIAWML